MITTRTIVLVVSFITFALIHKLGLALALYWHFWWFDMPMHFFGGVIVALGLYVLVDFRFPGVDRLLRPIQFLLAVFTVTVAWELFELWAGIPIESDYLLDTGIDLTLGLLGGSFGYILGRALARI